MTVKTPDTGSTFDGYEVFGTDGVAAVETSDWINISDCSDLVVQFAPKAGAGADDFECKVQVASNNGNGKDSPVILATKTGADGDTSYSITDNCWSMLRFDVTKLTASGNPSYVMLSGRKR